MNDFAKLAFNNAGILMAIAPIFYMGHVGIEILQDTNDFSSLTNRALTTISEDFLRDSYYSIIQLSSMASLIAAGSLLLPKRLQKKLSF